nr:alpha tocopherol transfer protein [Hymenolepis microstoma]
MAHSSKAEQKLSSMYKKLAKTNLGEEFKNDSAHCEAMRRWLSSMPHLTCPTDDEFLLMFLRQCKFSHSKTQSRLDNFCTLSTRKSVGDYIWATPVDLQSKRLEYYLNIGLHVPLGYMESGPMVMAVRPSVLNQEEMRVEEAFYFAYKVIYMVNSDPRALIGGVILILDATGATSKNVISDPNTIRSMLHFTQEAMPGRVKRMIFYNEGKFMDAMLSIFMFYMKDKMKKRMLRCGSDIKVALEAEPDLKAVLPSDLGGDGKSYKELVEANKKNFHAFYSNGDKTGEIKVDESKRPTSAKDFLHEYKDYDVGVMGKSGTYVKIGDEI